MQQHGYQAKLDEAGQPAPATPSTAPRSACKPSRSRRDGFRNNTGFDVLRAARAAPATNPVFSTRNFRAVPERFRTLVPEYVKDCVSLNQFAA